MIRARKRFGQHFLEPAWIDKVIRAIGPNPDEAFIEIGPGPGALTRPLAARVRTLVAYEIDRDLAADLRASALANLTVVEADFLTVENLEPRTRNPEPRTGNPRTRNPEPGTWNPEPGTANAEPRTPNPGGAAHAPRGVLTLRAAPLSGRHAQPAGPVATRQRSLSRAAPPRRRRPPGRRSPRRRRAC